MLLLEISAHAHLSGNAIELTWTISHDDRTANPNWQVNVVRSSIRYPESPDEDVSATGAAVLEPQINDDGSATYYWLDSGLRGETVYYYALFPHTVGAVDYQFDERNRASAMATARYNLADQLYSLLPGIYHRYDIALPPAGSRVPPSLQNAGQLRRFLEISGAQLDQFYSLMRAMNQLYNVDQVDGELLPLLAAWIDWDYDARQGIDSQRNEIRFAPYIYKTVGIIPTIEATVKRIIGWESRTKEFVHNVLLTNSPELLNLWQMQFDTTGHWMQSSAPFSIDSAYGGRLSVTQDMSGHRWLFYHALEGERSEVRYKIYDGGTWSPSHPFTSGIGESLHPAAVTWNGQMWVFWDVYEDGRWGIRYRRSNATSWDSPTSFATSVSDMSERRKPSVVVDGTNDQLWLFWESPTANGVWQVRYSCFNAGTLPTPSGSSIVLFAEMDDLYPLIRNVGGTPRLWLFWARRESGAPHRREIAYTVKGSLNPALADWGAVQTVPKTAVYSDREPFPLIEASGNIKLFWSSKQDGSWSIRCATLTGTAWSITERVTGTPYTQHDPAAFVDNGTTILLYRDNRILNYTSKLYTATETYDYRYSGSMTVDTQNRAKLDLWKQFEDFQTYIYDTGRTADNWYARDTVGMFLTPTTDNPVLINRNRDLINSVLRQFLPIQVRLVLIIEPTAYNEVVYSYDFGNQPPPWIAPGEPYTPSFIRDEVNDTLTEIVGVTQDAYTDTVPGWVWLRTWQANTRVQTTVDTRVIPIDTHFRIFHLGLEEG